MLYAIVCMDKSDHSHVRMENRPAHLEYLKSHVDHAVFVGPMLTDDSEGMIGSLLVMDFETRSEADTFAENDPYNQAGLFETVTIAPWKKVIPAD